MNMFLNDKVCIIIRRDPQFRESGNKKMVLKLVKLPLNFLTTSWSTQNFLTKTSITLPSPWIFSYVRLDFLDATKKEDFWNLNRKLFSPVRNNLKRIRKVKNLFFTFALMKIEIVIRKSFLKVRTFSVDKYSFSSLENCHLICLLTGCFECLKSN